MDFDQRGWISEVAAGTLAGIGAGAFGALIVADASIAGGAATGGAIGLAMGLLFQPLRWLFEQRPPQKRQENTDDTN
jgi:hypothetical protein